MYKGFGMKIFWSLTKSHFFFPQPEKVTDTEDNKSVLQRVKKGRGKKPCLLKTDSCHPSGVK